MLIHWAMVYYLPFAAYTLSNKGLFKHTSENATNVEKTEVDFLVEKKERILQKVTRKRFIDFMCFNNSDYPEYNSNSNDDVNPDTKIIMVTGRYNKPKVENLKKLTLYLAKVEQLKK